MIKSNAILILKTFSETEVKLFEEFLNSPFFNKNTKVIELYKVLIKYHPEYKDEKITSKNLFKELYKNLKFKESHVRNLFSDLNILGEKFIQYIRINNNYTYDKLLIEELNNRNIPELLGKKIRTLEKKINSVKLKDHDYFINRIFIYEMKSFIMTDKSLIESYRPDEISSKIKLFMLSLMESSLHLIVEEQRARIKHDFGFLKHSLDYLRNHITDFEDSPLLLIYYNLILCFFEKNDEKYFFIVKELLRINFSSFSRIDKKNIYGMMQTYCAKRITKGDRSYDKEFLNILQEMLQLKIVTQKEKDFISLNFYRNIIILCFNLKEVSILKKFIPDYINSISFESRMSVAAYSNAHLSFLQNNFEKALDLCNKIDFNDLLTSTNDNLYFKNDVKKLILMCFYELNFLESAISLIDTHKHFLKNSRFIKEEMRKKNMNFLNFVNDLIKLKIKFDDFELVKFKNKVLSTKGLTYLNWILEKIGEMENKIIKLKVKS